MMIQRSYISSVSRPMSTEELVQLLHKCLTNNRREKITGMLLYGNGTFLQTVEGEEKSVDSLFEKILQDPRHCNVKSLTRKVIESRQYAEWNMGFKRMSDEKLKYVEGLIDFTEKKFTFEYLAQNMDEAQRLVDHFSSWDPLVKKIEETEETVKYLRTMLAHARGCVEIATLVLESVATTGRTGPLTDEDLRVCDLALSALRQHPETFDIDAEG